MVGPRLRAADAGIAVLAVVTTALVGYALKGPDSVPAADADTVTTTPSLSASPSPAQSASAAPSTAPSTPAGTVGDDVAVVVRDSTLLAVDVTADCAASTVYARRSANAGVAWGRVAVPARSLRSVDARGGLGLASAYADGCAPLLLRTDNLGASWQPIANAPALRGVAVGDATHAWALSASEVVTSSDSGATWAKVSAPCARTRTQVGPPKLIVAADAVTAWVLCAAAPVNGRQARLLLRTTNGGRSWDEMAGARSAALDDGGRRDGLDGTGVLTGLSFADRSTGVVLLRETACAAGDLLVSTDGGSMWKPVPCVASVAKLLSVRALTATEWLALGRLVTGELVTLRTANAGALWTAPTPIT
jgi:hypothetical protein